jgi:ABC-type transport system involved in multi-copper enzyme maturation permease subunit
MLQKKILWFGFAYSIFLFMVFSNPIFRDFVYIMTAFGISYIAIIGAIQTEYKNNSDIVLNSLPISRREIVLSKYLTIFVFAGIALLIVAIIGLFFHLAPLPFEHRLININDILITLISVLLLSAVSLPAYFKTGAQWLRVINIIVFMLIFFAPAQIARYVLENQHQPGLQKLIDLAQQNPWLLAVSSLVTLLVLLLLSYLLAVRIYSRRDF